MEDAFVASEVDSEPLTIDKTLFRPHKDVNVEDIPGLDSMPAIIRDTLLQHRSVFANDLSASSKNPCTCKSGRELTCHLSTGGLG